MALVTYSDSEGESDTETVSREEPATARKVPTKPSFKPLVDRGNPRKIVVNLSDTKEDGHETGSGEGNTDGPARKRQRTGTGNGFAGFNDLLPAPKRAAAASKQPEKKQSEPTKRKPFNLKTSATPGFDRSGGMDISEGSYDEFGGISKNDNDNTGSESSSIKRDLEEGFQKKGNVTMFKPLSVARNKPKRKTTTTTNKTQATSAAEAGSNTPKPADSQASQTASRQRPKVSLFGFSSGETTTTNTDPGASNAQYEPLVYNPTPESAPAGPEPQQNTEPDMTVNEQLEASKTSTKPQDLASVANDLNLSQAEMRQLMGRNHQGATAAKVLNFNTNEEYRSNAEYLASASEAEIAAQQHRPVRAIAPGKHSLSQLVNAVSNQRDALEESFASGKRNRKEASSRYGW